MTTPSSTSDNDPVTDWMESLGFTRLSKMYTRGHLSVQHDEAAFFYQQMLEAHNRPPIVQDAEELRQKLSHITGSCMCSDTDISCWYWHNAKEFIDRGMNVREATDAVINMSDEAVMQIITAQTQLAVDSAVVEAEDAVIAIAHRKPCDCGSNDHFPVPVRSVMGPVTYYCQFSRVELSAALQQQQKDDSHDQ